ncbi:DNA mismatch endonuclease Vsr [Herbaspirillum sp. C9C3]|uniref:very short patch repair endonuclease n=1 Tax=Herbaspirillum sp. C9C3 TaxID=2735271 RepID=UPI0015859D94|nr:DNA mismatch endonuclease Vsr [Herbaspirillum sp. C9C3]NUT60035.1 DNA mismatch endonuclease Vsr [Herbaspirillum sp. C9C3]
MDVVDRSTRSRMMAGIRSKNTLPEKQVRLFLHARGFRYLLHDKRLPGSPDIVLPKYRVAIFVHGCFWHQHQRCKKAAKPKTNPEKWASKFTQNVERDRSHLEALESANWKVIVIWECGLGRSSDNYDALHWLPEAIRNPSVSFREWPLISD